ncbi:MAG: hypothetical protein RLZZ347_843 [Candidatus Parcubacteria bacterium]|jgi:hypothetical protein
MESLTKKIFCWVTLFLVLSIIAPIEVSADAVGTILNTAAAPGNLVNSAVGGITPRGGINYVPLQPLPDQPQGNSDFKTYLVYAFKAGISVAGILSVLMLVIAGFQYATTDAFTGKEESKAKMTNVFAGLILILVSYILLNTVNKDTVSLKLDFGADRVQIGGGFTGGLSALRYAQAQAALDNTIRVGNQAYQAGTDAVNTLTNRITALQTDLNSIIEGGDPEQVQKLQSQITDLQNQKDVLAQQVESARLGTAYQTQYDQALQNLNNPSINKAAYDLAKFNFQNAQNNYQKLETALLAGDQASKDAAKVLELRWNAQVTAYNDQLRNIEQKYPSFISGNTGYTGGNYMVPGAH